MTVVQGNTSLTAGAVYFANAGDMACLNKLYSSWASQYYGVSVFPTSRVPGPLSDPPPPLHELFALDPSPPPLPALHVCTCKTNVYVYDRCCITTIKLHSPLDPEFFHCFVNISGRFAFGGIRLSIAKQLRGKWGGAPPNSRPHQHHRKTRH